LLQGTSGEHLHAAQKGDVIRHILWKDIELIRLAGVGSGGSVYKANLNMQALLGVDMASSIHNNREETPAPINRENMFISAAGIDAGLTGDTASVLSPAATPPAPTITTTTANTAAKLTEGTDIPTKCCVACKRFNRDTLATKADLRKNFYRELNVLSTLQHPNIMQLLGVSEHGPFVWHISEYVRFGSLAEVLQSPSAERLLPACQRLKILTNIADALDYMHRQPATIIHRDIKPSNILITRDLRGKLSDFAYSRKINGPARMTRCGTPAYVAPEVMLGQPYDESIDTYAFGVVMWQVMMREVPYASDHDPMSILKKTSRGERPMFCAYETLMKDKANKDLTETVYDGVRDLTLRCWAQEAAARPSMETVVAAHASLRKICSV
jgi:serine/threonine protein kinase